MAATGLGLDWALPETVMDDLHRRAFTADAQGPERALTGSLLRATVGSLEDMLRLVGSTEAPPDRDIPSRVTGPRLSSAEATGTGDDTPWGAALDVLQAALPVEGQVTGPSAIRSVTARTATRLGAVQEALAQGLRGPALSRRVAQLETDTPADTLDPNGESAALIRQAFGEDIGRLGRSALEVPGGRLVMPFLTPQGPPGPWWGPESPTLSRAAAPSWRWGGEGGAGSEPGPGAPALEQKRTAPWSAWPEADGPPTGHGMSRPRRWSPRRARACALPGHDRRQAGHVSPRARHGGQLVGMLASYAEASGAPARTGPRRTSSRPPRARHGADRRPRGRGPPGDAGDRRPVRCDRRARGSRLPAQCPRRRRRGRRGALVGRALLTTSRPKSPRRSPARAPRTSRSSRIMRSVSAKACRPIAIRSTARP